jgi:hypothetical protein
MSSRAPAAEIEMAGRRTNDPWGRLTAGLDARIEPVDKALWSPDPGRPILVSLRIRNRRGVENASPTEFLRRGGDGRPALRRGVTLSAYHAASKLDGSDMPFGRPEELEPKRTDHFDPVAATRPLAPFEDFEAMRIDLNDWLDLTRRGNYRVRCTFTADSGLGAGTIDWWFTVGGRGGFVP